MFRFTQHQGKVLRVKGKVNSASFLNPFCLTLYPKTTEGSA